MGLSSGCSPPPPPLPHACSHAPPPPAASPSWAFFSSSLCFLFSINMIHAKPAGPVTAQGQLYFSAVNPGHCKSYVPEVDPGIWAPQEMVHR